MREGLPIIPDQNAASFAAKQMYLPTSARASPSRLDRTEQCLDRKGHGTQDPPTTFVRSSKFDADLVALLPKLRTFACSLCRNPALADDLVQDTVASAMACASSYTPGSNMRAWLFTILRNHFFSILRRRCREVEDVEGTYADGLLSQPMQNHCADLDDTMHALSQLPEHHRKALMLVGRDGLSYGEAARRDNCAVGTIKSRISRARGRLVELLEQRSGRALSQEGHVVGPSRGRPARFTASACALQR